MKLIELWLLLFLFLLISCPGFPALSHLFTFLGNLRIWCNIWIFYHFLHQTAYANTLAEKQSPACEWIIFIFLKFPKDSTHDISYFSFSESLSLSISHTHQHRWDQRLRSAAVHKLELRVEMLLVGPVVGIKCELQRACSLLAHAHFTLSQWHWGLTRALLLCNRFSPAKLLSGKQANKSRLTPGWG